MLNPGRDASQANPYHVLVSQVGAGRGIASDPLHHPHGLTLTGTIGPDRASPTTYTVQGDEVIEAALEYVTAPDSCAPEAVCVRDVCLILAGFAPDAWAALPERVEGAKGKVLCNPQSRSAADPVLNAGLAAFVRRTYPAVLEEGGQRRDPAIGMQVRRVLRQVQLRRPADRLAPFQLRDGRGLAVFQHGFVQLVHILVERRSPRLCDCWGAPLLVPEGARLVPTPPPAPLLAPPLLLAGSSAAAVRGASAGEGVGGDDRGGEGYHGGAEEAGAEEGGAEEGGAEGDAEGGAGGGGEEGGAEGGGEGGGEEGGGEVCDGKGLDEDENGCGVVDGGGGAGGATGGDVDRDIGGESHCDAGGAGGDDDGRGGLQSAEDEHGACSEAAPLSELRLQNERLMRDLLQERKRKEELLLHVQQLSEELRKRQRREQPPPARQTHSASRVNARLYQADLETDGADEPGQGSVEPHIDMALQQHVTHNDALLAQERVKKRRAWPCDGTQRVQLGSTHATALLRLLETRDEKGGVVIGGQRDGKGRLVGGRTLPGYYNFPETHARERGRPHDSSEQQQHTVLISSEDFAFSRDHVWPQPPPSTLPSSHNRAAAAL